MTHYLAALLTIEGVLMTISPTEIGQAVIAVIIIFGYLAQRRAQQDAKVKQEEIHILVNSRLTEALNEIRSLKVTNEAKDEVIASQAQAAEDVRTVPVS